MASQPALISSARRHSTNIRRTIAGVAGGGGLLLFASVMLANLANFGFHAIASRVIGPSGYGALGTLLGVMLMLSIPMAALQVAVTRVVSADRSGRRGTLSLFVKICAVAGVAGVVALALAPLLRSFLHLPQYSAVLLVGPYLAVCIVVSGVRGIALGRQRFRITAIAIAVATVSRLVLGAIGASVGGVTGALAATVIGEAIGGLILIPLAWSKGEQGDDDVVIGWRAVMSSSMVVGGLWLLNGVDMLLARHYLDGVMSGKYVAAANAARALLMIPQAVLMISLPKMVAYLETGRRGDAQRSFKSALYVTAAGVAVVGGFVAIAAGPILTVLFGSTYASAANLLRIETVEAAMAAMITICCYYLMSRHSPVALVPWIGAVITTVLVVKFHSTPNSIAWLASLTMLPVLGIVAWWALHAPADSRHRQGDLWKPSTLDLTVVVPMYNPGPRVADNLRELVRVLETSGLDFEVVAADDGSHEECAHAVTGLVASHHRVRYLPLEHWGKGHALRAGISQARGNWIGFIDVDGDIPFSTMRDYLAVAQLYEPHVVYASKRHPLSDIDAPVKRHVMSWGFQRMTRIMFRLPVRDTQCGAKLLRRDVAAAVIPRMREHGFAFDVEMFALTRRLGYRRYFEMPVAIRERLEGSSIKPSTVVRMFADSMCVWARLCLTTDYQDGVETTLEEVIDAEELDSARQEVEVGG